MNKRILHFTNSKLRTQFWFRLSTVILFFLLFKVYGFSIPNENDSLRQVIKTNTGIKKVDACNELALSYIGSRDSASYYADIAIVISLEHNYEEGLAKAFYSKGAMFSFSGDNEKAIVFFGKALEKFKTTKNNKYIGKCLNLIGTSYQGLSEFSKALESFNLAVELSDSAQVAAGYTNIGELFSLTGNQKDAIKYLNKSIAICENENFQLGIAKNYMVLAFIYSDLNDLEKTIEFFRKSQSIFEELKNEIGTANSINNIGVVYLKNKEYEKSIDILKKSLEVYKKLKFNHGILSTNLNISQAWYELGAYSLARDYFLESKKTSDIMDNKLLECEVLYMGAKLSNKLGETNKSINLYNESLKIASKISLWNMIVKISKDLSVIYKSEGNLAQAIEYNEMYVNAKDSLMNVEKAREIERLKFSFDISNMENEMALQQTKIELLEEKKQNIKSLNISIVVGSFVLLIFGLFSFYRQRKINRVRRMADEAEKALIELNLKQETSQKDQLTEIIAFKNKQLTNLALHITEKNDLLVNFKSILKKIKKSVKEKSAVDLIQDILIDISQNVNVNKERLEFYKEIKEINQTFLYTLYSKYPALTEKEQKLAALLRINLSTKQIATLMGLTPESVNVYRHNLRKKLGVDKNEVLRDFLNKI